MPGLKFCNKLYSAVQEIWPYDVISAKFFEISVYVKRYACIGSQFSSCATKISRENPQGSN